MKKIKVMYFSATGNTEKVINAVKTGVVEAFEDKGTSDLEIEVINFTSLKSREKVYTIEENQVLVIGLPVYAGRLPNKILPFVHNNIKGKGARAVAVVTFGNRNPDDGLSELVYELSENGFNVAGAAAVVCRHAFADIAIGRPSEKDIEEIRNFGKKAGEKIVEGDMEPAIPEGNMPPGPYYTPKKEDGSPAKFLKAKPVTDLKKCTECGICADVCPMDSISHENYAEVNGICIKCQACISSCPEGAKYFDNPDFLSHKRYLEKYHSEPTESRF